MEKQNIDDEYQRWCSLPEELLELVLSHLSYGDEAIFHCVCKRWQTIVRPRPRPHHQPQPPNLPNFDGIEFSSPWLISISPKNDGTCNFFNPINNHTFDTNLDPLLDLSYYLRFSFVKHDSRFSFAKYGWLLMIRESLSEIFLFQPLTKEKIQLPDLLAVSRRMKLLITCSPQSPNCLVIGVKAATSNTLIYIHKLGDSETEWNRIVLDDLPFQITVDCNPTFYKGKYYCLDRNGNLLTFDPTDVEGSYICIPNTKEKPMFDTWFPWLGGLVHEIFMVENDGDLLAILVIKGLGRFFVYVYKWHESDKKFVSVKSLGDNMVFVSNGAAFSQKATVRGTGNKIYFPTFFNNGAYAFYSLATKRFHSFLTGLSPANPCCPLSEDPKRIWFSPIQQ